MVGGTLQERIIGGVLTAAVIGFGTVVFNNSEAIAEHSLGINNNERAIMYHTNRFDRLDKQLLTMESKLERSLVGMETKLDDIVKTVHEIDKDLNRLQDNEGNDPDKR